MRLSELNPQLRGTLAAGTLRFDCPFPACNKGHRIVVAISDQPYHERQPIAGLDSGHDNRGAPAPDYSGPPLPPLRKVKVWQASGTFPDTLTLAPSIDVIEADEQGNKKRTICWHGFVRNGDVT